MAPYGKILADTVEDSNGNVLDLTSITSSEATTSARGYMSAADKTKLDGIEESATADQTGAEIKAAYEAEADTNAFTDADHTKLDSLLFLSDTAQTATTTTASSSNGISGSDVDHAIEDYGNGYFTIYQTGPATSAATAWFSDFNTAVAAASGTSPLALTITIDEGGQGTNQYVYQITDDDDGDPGFTSVSPARADISSPHQVVSMSIPGATTYSVSITGSNDPVFDSTRPVTIDGVIYAANTWTVSGSTATQTFAADPSIAQGATITQEYVKLEDLATVATTGDYDDLTNKPTISTAYIGNTVNTWHASSDNRERLYFATDSHTYLKSSDDIVFRTDNSDTNVGTIDGGNLTMTGNVTAYSDINLKENIEVIPNALEKVSEIRGVTYDRKDIEGPRHAGVIAQEVEAVLPEVVMTDKDGVKSVAYGNIVGLLIEAVKELKAEVETLKQERN